MSDKSGKECGCPQCREARGEKPEGISAVERARIVKEEFAPLLEQHSKITQEMLNVLAKMNDHKTVDMGKDFAMTLNSSLMAFIDTASKPGTPSSAKFQLFDVFVKHARVAMQAAEAENDIPPELRAILEGLGIDLNNAKVVSFEV